MASSDVHGWRLSHEARLAVRRGIAAGDSFDEVARTVGCSRKTVQRVLGEHGGLAIRARPRPKLRLSETEREEISLGLQAGLSLRELARRLERAPSTVSREVGRCGGRKHYRAVRAERAARRRAERPKVAKLVRHGKLRARVTQMLSDCWSPRQISARLVVDFPDDPETRVSAETIYQSLFVQSRGALRKELARCLRSGRTRRRPRGRPERKGRLKDMVMIADRPAEVEDRAVPGHWEGDLIVGAHGKSAVVTLVERSSRFVLLARIGTDQTSRTVCAAIARRIKQLPKQLRLSLTWDQGKELAQHAQFSIATDVAVYFCDPHSPWQRGSNENTNGLLRQFLPKGTDLSVHSQARLDRIASLLNGRPRQTLGWMKPSERFAQLVASTV